MNEPEWIELQTALVLHQEQLIEHGGADGIRDIGLLESALARAQHLWSYGQPELCALAASYAFGIARNHPFIDGNKRTAFSIAALFLSLNGRSLEAPEVDAVVTMLKLASGNLTEEELAAWFLAHTAPA